MLRHLPGSWANIVTLYNYRYSSPHKIEHIGRYFAIPPRPRSRPCEEAGLPPPPLFIINCLIPGYAPPNPLWGAAKTDGEGYALTFFYELTEASLAEWENADTFLPAIALLRRFVDADLDDDDFHLRMKVRIFVFVFLFRSCFVFFLLGLRVRQLFSSLNYPLFSSLFFVAAFLGFSSSCFLNVFVFEFEEC